MKKIFQKTQEKYIRGIYYELDLLTEQEKEKSRFKLTFMEKKELLMECHKYMDSDLKRDYKLHINRILKASKNAKNDTILVDGVSYLHHHFLNGNSIFTHAINQCSKRWTIMYLEHRRKPFEIPLDPEMIFLGFLGFFTEKDQKDQYQVQSYLVEHYLFVLEMLGYIERKRDKIYLKNHAYQEAEKILDRLRLTDKRDKNLY